MADPDVDARLRRGALDWLERRGPEKVTRAELSSFVFEGERIALIDPQRGIRKPARLDAALSITTTFTPPSKAPPYEDQQGADGLLRYKYRGDDPDHPENVALRNAWRQGLPLIWFVGVAPGVFTSCAPVWLVADEPAQRQFVLALDEYQRTITPGAATLDQRRYAERITRARLHQPLFRARVLDAYTERCAVCRLGHAPLLDAAHILPDGSRHGTPVVPNGLALCKIHHAAFDQHILGVRPDLVVEIRRDVLDEIDGPMLRHGLQEMHGSSLTVPRSVAARPTRERLEERYEQFRAA